MKVGVGYCNNRDAYYSGRSAAGDAIRNGDLRSKDFAIAFCAGQLDHAEFLRGMQEIIGDTPIIGGSSVGVITNTNLSYTGFPSAVAIFQLDKIKYQVAAVEGLCDDEKAAGWSLANKFHGMQDDKLLLMFYDSIKVPATAASLSVLNASPPLIAGIESNLQSSLPVIGAGLLGDYQFNKAKQFCGSDIYEQSVVGAAISGPVHVYHTVMHGCSPLDGKYRQITKMHDSVINELDGVPIVEVIDKIYGDQEWRKQHPLDLLTIGVNYGEKYRYQEEKYVNRLITGILPDGSGIRIFEPDLEQGMEIQFMLRDGNKMIESARDNSKLVMENIIDNGKTPVFAFYVDCAGRAAKISNTESEEAAEVQRVMNEHNTPMLGFYSGVEIGPILGKNRGLDWTGVLLVLAEDK